MTLHAAAQDYEQRERQRTEARARVRRDVQRLEVSVQSARTDFERACASLALGVGTEEAVAETERELAVLEHELRRAQAALAWLG